MDKVAKTLVLLVIVGALVVGAMWYAKTRPPEPGPAGPAIEAVEKKKPAQDKPRLEEKYGVTSGGVGGG